jgi:hypothetical protein
VTLCWWFLCRSGTSIHNVRDLDPPAASFIFMIGLSGSGVRRVGTRVLDRWSRGQGPLYTISEVLEHGPTHLTLTMHILSSRTETVASITLP